MENTIEATGLELSYGSTRALAGVDLSAPAGTVLGVLGPNGAGKTTAVRVLATLLRADSGTARICGHDVAAEPDRVRELIGLTGQYASVDEDLTGRQNLVMIGRLLGLSRPEAHARATELLGQFSLADAGGRSAKTYSGGMRRRLDLAASLVNRPRVLFLDEPTTGLDPRSRRAMWDIVRELVADGVTILLTTQYLDEADQLADRIGVLDQGRLVAEGTSEELKRLVPGGSVRLQFSDSGPLESAARALGLTVSDPAALALDVPGDGSLAQLKALLARLDDAAVEVAGLTVHTPDLDDVFLALTGRPTADEKVPTP